VDNYVEPFFGSGAVLLSRPGFSADKKWTETVNDADGFICNFWRALQSDPDAVAYYADWPVNESDLHARHAWLVNRRARLTWALDDPDYYDAKIAGWWVWGMASWIGSGFCSGAGPWVSDGAHIREREREDDLGIKRQRPHLGNAGNGINRQLPNLGNAGQGIKSARGANLQAYFAQLAERLRHVRVCCGDWSRVITDSVTFRHGLTAVLLDPPYSDDAQRDENIYAVDCLNVAHDVREWCIANGDNPMLRIALCGYDGEHNELEQRGWRVFEWKAQGGMGNQGNGGARENAKRERIWYSPACLDPAQGGLF
jgi:hypothetical protein